MPISIALTAITGANADALGGSIDVIGGIDPSTVLYVFSQPARGCQQPADG